MNENKIVLPFSIDKDGKFLLNKNDKEALEKFKGNHPGQSGEMILEFDNGPKAKQHRLYRGNILPAIFEICGGLSKEHFHRFVLKPMFKTFRITDVNELPKRYLNCHRTGDFYFKERTVDGVVEQWIEYVPSTAAFTVQEMDEYIENCRKLLRGLEAGESLEEIQQLMRG